MNSSRILFVLNKVKTVRSGVQLQVPEIAILLRNVGYQIGIVGRYSKLPSIYKRLLGNDIKVFEEDIHQSGISGILRLLNIVREYNPDIIQSYSRSADITSSIVSFLMRKPQISVIGEMLPTWNDKNKPSHLKIFFHKYVLRRIVAKLVSTSAFARLKLADYVKIEKDKIVVIPNTLNENISDSRERNSEDNISFSNLKSNPLVVLIGRLSPEKRPENLIKLAKILKKEGSKAHFLFVGEGIMKNELSDLVKQEKVEEIVHFLGSISDIPSLLNQINILVHFCDVEGFGLAVAEAMSCSVPVVCSNGGSLPELVSHGETGYLVNSNDIKEYGTIVEKLISDRKHADYIGRNSKKWITENIISENITGMYVKLYDKILSEK